MTLRPRPVPWVTLSLLLLLTVTFVLQQLGPGWVRWALVPAQGWRSVALLTHVFWHAGVGHLAGNLLFLAAFGPDVEGDLGGPRFAALFVASALAGGLAKVLADSYSSVPMVGASSAISGVMAAALALGPHRPVLRWVRRWVPLRPVPIPTWVFVVAWLGLQIAAAYASLGATHSAAPFAHLGGFLAGLGLAYVLRPC